MGVLQNVLVHVHAAFPCCIKIQMNMNMKINIKMHPESGMAIDMDTGIGLP
jgi:hypothetical protein